MTILHFYIFFPPVISTVDPIDSFNSPKELIAKPLINGALVYYIPMVIKLIINRIGKERRVIKPGLCFYKTTVGWKVSSISQPNNHFISIISKENYCGGLFFLDKF